MTTTTNDDGMRYLRKIARIIKRKKRNQSDQRRFCEIVAKSDAEKEIQDGVRKGL